MMSLSGLKVSNYELQPRWQAMTIAVLLRTRGVKSIIESFSRYRSNLFTVDC